MVRTVGYVAMALPKGSHMRKNITDRTLKAMKPGDEVMDTIVPSFGVRASATRKAFILVKRFPGSPNPTRRTIGAFGELTFEQARARARQWLELIGKGIDPAQAAEASRQAQIAAERAKQRDNFGSVFDA